MAIVDGKIRCSCCKEWKPVEDYQKSTVLKGCGECRSCKYAKKRERETRDRPAYNARVRAYRATRRDQNRERSRAWLAADKDRAKGYGLKKYGITLVEYRRLLEEQGGGCAICGATENKNGKHLFVDHCHQTGVVRGILCHKCNTGLGSFKDSAELVVRAGQYLSRAH